MSFRYALGGKLFRGQVRFAAVAEVTESIVGAGVGGGLTASDYAVIGLPLAQAIDTVTIDTAAAAETYSTTIKGRTFTYTAGGAPTVTTIRDGLKALVDAAAAGMSISTATNGADAMDITALTPGDAIDTAVTAQTPANISLVASLNTAGGPVGIIGKKSGQLVIRSATAITASFDLAIVG